MMENFNDANKYLEDIIYEILTRVSLLSLPSCLGVCRNWRRIAYEPHFDAAHSHHIATDSGFILQTIRHHKYHHSFISIHSSTDYDHPLPIPFSSLLPCDPKSLHIEATAPAHSLILYIKSENYDFITRYYVSWLKSSHHRRIPNPKTRYYTCGVALICDSSVQNDAFKVLRISKPRWSWKSKKAHLICEVFDSIANKWSRCNDLPFYMLRNRAGLVIKQTAYWMIDNGEANSSSCSVYAFNVKKNRGWVISGPTTYHTDLCMHWMWKMIAYEDKLCLVQLMEDDMKVWTTLECTNDDKRWEWKGSFSKKYIKDHTFAFEVNISDQKVALLETLYRELWYELRGRKLVDFMNPPQSIFRMHLSQCSSRDMERHDDRH